MRSLPLMTCLALSWSIATTAHAKVDVVATVPDLAALAREIGGDRVAITSLSLPTQDPHFVDARPSLVLKLNRAELLITVGLDLEVGWLPVLQTGARNPRVQIGGKGYLDCSTVITRMDVPAQAVDRSMGDIHPGGNPHYLFDPRQAARCAQAIGARLADLDPAGAKVYAANTKAFVERLDKARAGWEKRMAPFKGHRVITFHRSWTYLLDWLGLVSIGELEPKPGIPPTSRHVAALLGVAKTRGAKCVLQEAYYPDKTARLVAQKLGGQVVSLAAGADVARGETYVAHVDQMIGALEKALR